MKQRKSIDYYVLKIRNSNSIFFKLFRLFIQSFFSLSKIIPNWGNSIRSIEISQKIENYEKKGEYGTARRIRSKALKQLPSYCLGPLWRSEGEDKLYQFKDYKGALDSFEKSIAVMEKSGMFGVTSPDRVYYGAALSCLMLSDKNGAEKYYTLFKELVEKLAENKNLNLEWQLNGIKYLKQEIYTNGN